MTKVERNGCPVIEFDQESPDHARNWPDDFRAMRNECPRAWNSNHGGHWIASRYHDVIKIAQATDHFSTVKTFDAETGEPSGGVVIPQTPGPRVIPLETDKPEWQGFRSHMNSWFSPKAAEGRRPFARAVARTLVDRVIERGSLDFVDDLTNPLPAIFTMDLLGLDLGDWPKFAHPAHRFVFTKTTDPSFPEVVEEINGIYAALSDAIHARRDQPRDDLLTHLATGRINDDPISHDDAVQMALLLIFGGVDTTTALTSNVLIYLSENPQDRQALIDDPAKLPIAREEFVRYFSPIHGLGRNAIDDCEVDGWKFSKGDRVLLAYSSANRDEDVFADPDEVRIDRFPNRHVGFGAGMHRCLGSFFARVMFESMIEEVLKRMPDYKVVSEKLVAYPSVAQVNGWISIPATFTPGTSLGGNIRI